MSCHPFLDQPILRQKCVMPLGLFITTKANLLAGKYTFSYWLVTRSHTQKSHFMANIGKIQCCSQNDRIFMLNLNMWLQTSQIKSFWRKFKNTAYCGEFCRLHVVSIYNNNSIVVPATIVVRNKE